MRARVRARSTRSGGSLLVKEQKGTHQKRRIEARLSWPTCESLAVPCGVLALARVGIDEKFLFSFLAASALDPPVCPGWTSHPVETGAAVPRFACDLIVHKHTTSATCLRGNLCTAAVDLPRRGGEHGNEASALRPGWRPGCPVFTPSWPRWRWPSRAHPAPAWRHPRRPSSLSRTPPNRTSGGAPSPARAPSAPQRGRPWRAGRRRSR